MGSVDFVGMEAESVYIWGNEVFQTVVRKVLVRSHGMIGSPRMKTLVLFISIVSVAVCWGPQPVQDTPEVSAAKAAHLAALAKAKQEAREKSRPVPQQSWNVDVNTIKQEPWKKQWTGDGAQDQWNQVDPAQNEDDGSWRDDGTWQNYDDGSWREPEVTEAPKVENKWATIGEPSKWTGPIALPPGYDEAGAPLPVEDTPEVAAAKAKHLQAYVRAAAKIAPSAKAVPVALKKPTVSPLRPSHNSLIRPNLPNKPLVRAPLPPHLQNTRVVPKEPAPIYEADVIDGVVDTPEVAAAKAAHFAAHAKRRLQ